MKNLSNRGARGQFGLIGLVRRRSSLEARTEAEALNVGQASRLLLGLLERQLQWSAKSFSSLPDALMVE